MSRKVSDLRGWKIIGSAVLFLLVGCLWGWGSVVGLTVGDDHGGVETDGFVDNSVG